MITAVKSKDKDFSVSNYEIENMYRSHGEHWFLNHLSDKLIGNRGSLSISHWENNTDFDVSRGFIISISWIIVTFLFSNLKSRAPFTNKNNLQLVTVAKHCFLGFVYAQSWEFSPTYCWLVCVPWIEVKALQLLSSLKHLVKRMYRLNVKLPWVARKM